MSRARRVAIILVCTAVSFYCAGCNALDEINKLTVEDLSVSAVKDGNYQGYQNNFPVTAKVRVSVKDGKVTEIRLLRHIHGPNHGADGIVGRVMEKQSLLVDAISGATHSSKVVLKAIESALKQGL